MIALRCSTKMLHTSSVRQNKSESIYHRAVRFFSKKKLFLTNSFTSAGCRVVGDLIEQEFEYQSKLISQRYDWVRAGRMFIIGTLLGTLHHYYYIYLDKLMPKTNLKTVFQKIVCDQTIASPVTIVCFFYGMGLLENKSMETCSKELKMKFKYVYLGDWAFWPPVQFVNFYFLPTHYRVVFINVASVIFNIFLSFMKHNVGQH